jgi:hypothetical protein
MPLELRPMATQPEEERVWTIPLELRRQLLAALSPSPDYPLRMTYDEFLTWATEDTCAEWENGKVSMPSLANTRHQLIVQLLALHVRRALRAWQPFPGAVPDETGALWPRT